MRIAGERMVHRTAAWTALAFVAAVPGFALVAPPATTPRAFIDPPPISAEEDARILKAFSGGARDTDEIVKQKVPLYLRRLGRGIRPGRNEVEIYRTLGMPEDDTVKPRQP